MDTVLGTLYGTLYALVLFGGFFGVFFIIINGVKRRPQQDQDLWWSLGLSIAAIFVVFGYFLGPHIK